MDVWIFAARTFMGINSEGWIAIATFVGAGTVLISGAAVLYSFTQYLNEQEARDVRRFYIDEGVLRLKQGLDGLLERTRINYSLAARLVVYVRRPDQQGLQRLRPGDIPPILPAEPLQWHAQAIGPAAKLIGAKASFGDLISTVIGYMYTFNIDLEFRIRHKVLNYYSEGQPTKVDLGDWPMQALNDAREGYSLAEDWAQPVSELLLEAAQVAQQMRFSRFKDIGKVQASEEMRKISKSLLELAEETEKRSKVLLQDGSADHSEPTPDQPEETRNDP